MTNKQRLDQAGIGDDGLITEPEMEALCEAINDAKDQGQKDKLQSLFDGILEISGGYDFVKCRVFHGSGCQCCNDE